MRRPAQGVTWQWQLSGRLDPTVPADVYDVDAAGTSRVQVDDLRRRGVYVVGYVDVGTFEPGRVDAPRFPRSALGATVTSWPGERWLDVRDPRVVALMAARVRAAATRGFDAVELDNTDGYDAETGFGLGRGDLLLYLRTLAGVAHEVGLAVGLKNTLDLVGELAPLFDFAVNERAVEYGEVGALAPFYSAGKAVFHAEYDVALSVACPITRPLGISTIRKRSSLGVWREVCPVTGG